MISAREAQKLSNDVADLKREIGRLRSLLISYAGIDREGTYRPSIVKELLKAAAEEPNHKYAGAGSLLKQLKALDENRL